jgi:hypothetical protein
MNIQVVFGCSINIERFEKKYSGWLRIGLPEKEIPAKKFWFILHYPYEKDLAEIAFYWDAEMTMPFAEGLGSGIYGTHWDTGKPMLTYHFGEVPLSTIGTIYIISKIVAACVQSIEQDIREARDYKKSTVVITDEWNQGYEEGEELVAQLFIEHMKTDTNRHDT